MNTPSLVFIDSFSHDGRGIARIEGKTLFLEGGLPGEEVSFSYLKRRSTWDEGKVLSVISPSEDRRIPKCEYFGTCGGCSLQHISSDAQLKHKEKVLLEQLHHFGQVVPETVLPPLESTTWGYRHKARLGVRFVSKKNKILAGFREKRSHFLLDMDHCEILHPKIASILLPLKTLLLSLQAFKTIPQIEVAVGDHEAALIFRHLEAMCAEDKALLIRFGTIYDIHIYLQPEGPASIEAIYPKDVNRLSYSLPDFGLEFLFHPTDFTQVNLDMNRKMVKCAMELLALSPTDRVLDLFCGLGNFSLAMARMAKQVVGIEGSEAMCTRARENAVHNQLDNVIFYSADLYGDMLKKRAEPLPAWVTQTYDAILLDPPRTGASQSVLDLIIEVGASKIVYVSCNPATLARDVGILVQQYGFRLVSVRMMDMFPHTTHVESMVLLVR